MDGVLVENEANFLTSGIGKLNLRRLQPYWGFLRANHSQMVLTICLIKSYSYKIEPIY